MKNRTDLSESNGRLAFEPVLANVFQDELDTEMFCCHRCKGEFSHIDGTWLPIGLTTQDYMTMLPEGTDPRFPTTPVAFFSLRPPEIITSDNFTCYDCLTEEDAADYIDLDYDIAGSI